MHIAVIKSKQGGKIYKSKLLRRSYREDGKVKKETLANLSHLDDRMIELLRGHLKGDIYAQPTKDVDVIDSRAHGDVKAISTVFQELDFLKLISSRSCRERDIVDRTCNLIFAEYPCYVWLNARFNLSNFSLNSMKSRGNIFPFSYLLIA